MVADNSTIQTGPSTTRGYLLVAGMSIFWGLSWPIMKIALLEISPWTFRALSLSCGGIGILLLAKSSGQVLSIPRNQFFPLLLVSALNVTGWHLGSAFGISHMQAGRAAILGFTMPLWASIASIYLLKEKITVQKVIGLLLGLSGLFILLQPQLESVGEKPIGAAFMIGAAISWGMGTVFSADIKTVKPNNKKVKINFFILCSPSLKSKIVNHLRQRPSFEKTCVFCLHTIHTIYIEKGSPFGNFPAKKK